MVTPGVDSPVGAGGAVAGGAVAGGLDAEGVAAGVVVAGAGLEEEAGLGAVDGGLGAGAATGAGAWGLGGSWDMPVPEPQAASHKMLKNRVFNPIAVDQQKSSDSLTR